MRPGRILLCSEGTGRGKGVYLAGLGRALAELGHRPAFALRHGSPAAIAVDGIGPVFDTPKGSLPMEQRLRPVVSCGDLLFNHGLSSVEFLTEKVMHWRLVIAEVVPDLVIADWATGATIAARERFPVMVTGNGFFTPPAEMERFPALHDMAAIHTDEGRLLDIVNAVTTRGGASLFETLPSLFAGNRQAVRTFSVLDPYAQWRRPETLFAPAADLSCPSDDGDEVFVYMWLSFDQHLLEILTDALCQLDMPVRVHSVSLTDGQKSRLAARGIAVEERPMAERDIVARSRLVVHGGGAMLTSLLIASGMPQLILWRSMEDLIHTRAAQAHGIGRSLRLATSGPDEIAAVIAEAYRDGEMRSSAAALRGRLTPPPAADWAARIASHAAELL